MLQLGARFYWPEVGRFVSQDPIGTGSNWYAYANDNPVYWIDADGRNPAGVIVVIGLGTIVVTSYLSLYNALHYLTHSQKTCLDRHPGQQVKPVLPTPITNFPRPSQTPIVGF